MFPLATGVAGFAIVGSAMFLALKRWPVLTLFAISVLVVLPFVLFVWLFFLFYEPAAWLSRAADLMFLIFAMPIIPASLCIGGLLGAATAVWTAARGSQTQ